MIVRNRAKVERSDWNIFSKHSIYLLIAGYFGVADQQVNTILISQLGSVDLAGNSLIGTMSECGNGRLGLLPTLTADR